MEKDFANFENDQKPTKIDFEKTKNGYKLSVSLTEFDLNFQFTKEGKNLSLFINGSEINKGNKDSLDVITELGDILEEEVRNDYEDREDIRELKKNKEEIENGANIDF